MAYYSMTSNELLDQLTDADTDTCDCSPRTRFNS